MSKFKAVQYMDQLLAKLRAISRVTLLGNLPTHVGAFVPSFTSHQQRIFLVLEECKDATDRKDCMEFCNTASVGQSLKFSSRQLCLNA